MPRVLGGDEIGAGEHCESAERNVGEIADRRRHEIESGLKRPRDQLGERFARARDRPAQRRFVPLLVTLLWHGAIARSRRKNVT
jgi:hypothetical protein